MTPWEVIEEALAQRRPPRGPAWLAEQLNERVQVVSNWKSRKKVPPSRYREVAAILGLTVDQLEGVASPPWEEEKPAATLSPEIEELAWQMQALPKHALERIVFPLLRSTIQAARDAVSPQSDGAEKDYTSPFEDASSIRRRANN